MPQRMNTEQGTTHKSWWSWLRIAGLIVGFGFMAWLLSQLLRDPNLLKRHFDLWGALGAVMIGVIGNLIVAVAFSDMVAKSAPSIDFERRISAYYYSQLAKYIPGQVAALLVQRSILAGPRASKATIMSNLELMMISCWLCGSAAVVLLVHTVNDAAAGLIVIATLVIGAWLIRKDWQPAIHRLTQLIPRFRALGAACAETNEISVARSIWLSAGMLVLPTASSYVLLTTGMNIDHTTALPLTASLMLAWVVGVLAFVFPAGIGIRELIFYGLGRALVSGPGAELMAEVAIASRLIHVLVDIVGVTLFFAAKQLHSRVAR
jgi:glycosyltransferase 2 family protein